MEMEKEEEKEEEEELLLSFVRMNIFKCVTCWSCQTDVPVFPVLALTQRREGWRVDVGGQSPSLRRDSWTDVT